jgi:nucleoid DNA-binding protein
MRTKKELIQAIHDTVPVTITKKQIEAVLDTQALVVAHALVAGPAVERLVTIPGVVKLHSVVVPAKSARSALNPATGGRIVVPAKPSSVRVKVKVLSKLTGKAVRWTSKIAPLHRPTRFEREDVI